MSGASLSLSHNIFLVDVYQWNINLSIEASRTMQGQTVAVGGEQGGVMRSRGDASSVHWLALPLAPPLASLADLLPTIPQRRKLRALETHSMRRAREGVRCVYRTSACQPLRPYSIRAPLRPAFLADCRRRPTSCPNSMARIWPCPWAPNTNRTRLLFPSRISWVLSKSRTENWTSARLLRLIGAALEAVARAAAARAQQPTVQGPWPTLTCTYTSSRHSTVTAPTYRTETPLQDGMVPRPTTPGSQVSAPKVIIVLLQVCNSVIIFSVACVSLLFLCELHLSSAIWGSICYSVS